MSNYLYLLDMAEKAEAEGNLETSQYLLEQAESLVNEQNPQPNKPVEEVSPEEESNWADTLLNARNEILEGAFKTTLAMRGAVGSAATETVGALDMAVDGLGLLGDRVFGDQIMFDTEGASEEDLQLWENVDGATLWSPLEGKEVKHLSYAELQRLRELKYEEKFQDPSKVTLNYQDSNMEAAADKFIFNNKDVDEIYETTGMDRNIVADITGGITQFVAGWVTLGKYAQPFKAADETLTATKRVVNATTKGAAVDFLVFEGHEARASDLAKSLGLENELLDFLSYEGNEDDSEFVARLRAAGEGGALGVAFDTTIEVAIKGFKWYRASHRSQDPNLTDEQRAEAAQQAEELDAELKEEVNKDLDTSEVVDGDGTTIKVETDETLGAKVEENEVKVEEDDTPLLDQKDIDDLREDLIKQKPEMAFNFDNSFEEAEEGIMAVINGRVDEARLTSDENYKIGHDVALARIDLHKKNAEWEARERGDAAEAKAKKEGNEKPPTEPIKPEKPHRHEPIYEVNYQGSRFEIEVLESGKVVIKGFEELGEFKTVKETNQLIFNVLYKSGDEVESPSHWKKVKREEKIDKTAEELPTVVEEKAVKVSKGEYTLQRGDETYKVNKQKNGTWSIEGQEGTHKTLKAATEEVNKLAKDKADPVDNDINYADLSPERLSVLSQKLRATHQSYGTVTGTKQTIAQSTTISKGKALITRLVKNLGVEGDDILDVVNKLKQESVKPTDLAAFAKGVQDFMAHIQFAIRLIERSPAYLKGDINMIKRKKMMNQAWLELHALNEGLGSNFGRALNVFRTLFKSKPKDLSKLWGENLENAKKKMLDEEAKKADTEIERLEKEKNLSPEDQEKLDLLKDARDMGIYNGTAKKSDMEKFKDRIKYLKKPFEFARRVQDIAVEFITGQLLLNIDTLSINMIANGLMTVVNNIETYAGSAVALTRSGIHSLLGNDEAALKALQAAKRQHRRGIVQFMGKTIDNRRVLHSVLKVLATNKNVLDPDFKVREEVRGEVDHIAIGKDDIDLQKLYEDILNKDWEELKDIPMSDWIGLYSRLAFRGLAAGDELFKQINYRSVLGSIIDSEWQKLGKHTDEDAETYWKLVMAEVEASMNITRKIREKEELLESEVELAGKALHALNKAREVTFTDKLGVFGQSIQKIVNQFPAFRIVTDMWFIRTPTNIFKYFGRRLPLTNLLSRRTREMLFGGDPDERDRAIGEMVLASSLAYGMAQVADMYFEIDDGEGGTIQVPRFIGTLDGTSYNHVKNKKLSGLQPHSFVSQDADTGELSFFNTQRLDPFDTMMMTIVNAKDLKRMGKHEEGDNLFDALTVSFINLTKDKTFTQGIATFFEALGDPTNKYESYVEAKGRTITPAVLKWIGDDPYYREVEGFRDAFISQIPTWSPSLPLRFDRLGDPVPKPEKAIMNRTNLDKDPVRREFLRMNSSIPDIPSKVGVVDLKSEALTLNGKTAWTRFNELYSGVDLNGNIIEHALIEKMTLKEHLQMFLSDPYLTDDLSKISMETEHFTLRGGYEEAFMAIMLKHQNQAEEILREEYAETGIEGLYQHNKLIREQATTVEFENELNKKPEEIITEWLNNEGFK